MDYLVTWQEARSASSNAFDIYGVQVDPGGQLGPVLAISTNLSFQVAPAVADGADGRFLVAYQNATNYAPDIVTIKLGTNDSKPQNWRYRDQFGRDLGDMIDVFAKLASHPRIFVCLPVPAYGLQYDINPEIIKNEIIPIIRQVARQKGVTTVDVYTPLSGHPDLFPDLVHPNNAGAVMIAATLHGALLK
jgi:lysophospholipase L1-like esterase